MFTQCPSCHTVYAVDAATLAQAHGNVGCGQCGATFNALTTLVETWPDTAPEVLPAYPTSPGPPILMMPVPRAALPPQTRPTATPGAVDIATATVPPETANNAAERAPDVADNATPPVREETGNRTMGAPEATDSPAVQVPDATDIPDANANAAAATVSPEPAPLPSFVRRARAAHRPRHRAYWALGCVVLALALAIQLVWADRVALTANATTRPWLAQACTWFGCRLPSVRDLADLELLSRDVRPHPNVPDALLISATVRNNAPFTQPYPIVSITLSDLDENRIAMRRFRPSEYIADPKVRAAGLAPGATAALMFEVKDPGRNAVAFQFGFQ